VWPVWLLWLRARSLAEGHREILGLDTFTAEDGAAWTRFLKDLAARAGKPVIVYDPYNQARNVMLRCVPKLVSSDLSEILSAVFESVSTLRRTTDA